MQSYIVCLDTLEKVKQFVNLMNTNGFVGDLTQGRYVVDACSILGVLALDLTRTIKLETMSDVKETLRSFIVDTA